MLTQCLIEFFESLKACISQFNHYTSCENQLTTLGNLINNDVRALIDSDLAPILKQVTNPGFKLYLTGYAQFFDQEITQRNNVSFNSWVEKPENQANLITELRISMNGLALDLTSNSQQLLIGQMQMTRGACGLRQLWRCLRRPPLLRRRSHGARSR